MYHHVVMFKFKEGADVEKMALLLEGLAQIKEVERVQVTRTDKCHVVFGSADILLHVVLRDKDAYELYDQAPYHVKCVKPALDEWLPKLKKKPRPGRFAVDYSEGACDCLSADVQEWLRWVGLAS